MTKVQYVISLAWKVKVDSDRKQRASDINKQKARGRKQKGLWQKAKNASDRKKKVWGRKQKKH